MQALVDREHEFRFVPVTPEELNNGHLHKRQAVSQQYMSHTAAINQAAARAACWVVHLPASGRLVGSGLSACHRSTLLDLYTGPASRLVQEAQGMSRCLCADPVRLLD